ncbi:putative leucine-rich repeat domain superfamily [Helianthus annuus]|nr:putative leucine-rich repeat domain superfamily [Helianthus annuus]
MGQEIPAGPVLTIGNEEDGEITFPPSPDNGKKPAEDVTDLPEEIAYANRVIQSLNSSSKVAYISGIGLKVIPVISSFTSLRSVNLSGNSIVNIAPGSLPKGLHVLNLSRNKISVIEGLRELTRLRILDLSYNRISRIGQGKQLDFPSVKLPFSLHGV